MSAASVPSVSFSKTVSTIATVPATARAPAPAPTPTTAPTTAIDIPSVSLSLSVPPRATSSMSMEIQAIFEKNKLSDLKDFVRKRKCLNEFNTVLMYLFHVVQSAGILTTTIAAGYDMKELIWIGVGINIVASLINIFEKTNLSISKHLMKDIEAIRNGTFVDESDVIEPPAPPAKTPLLSGNEKSEE